MANNEANILNDIQEKYVPFLKKLVAFAENNKVISPTNLNRLKTMYTVFTSASNSEQIQVFDTNRRKLDKWFKNHKKGKMTGVDSSIEGSIKQGPKRNLAVEDTDLSHTDLSEADAFKKIKSLETSNFFEIIVDTPVCSINPTPNVQMTKGNGDEPIEQSLPSASTSSNLTAVVTSSATDAVSHVNDKREVLFSCASCQYQTEDKSQFSSHILSDHPSNHSLCCKQCGKWFLNVGNLVSHISDEACTDEKMTYKCGMPDCTFETTSVQMFFYHLRQRHKGSLFFFCVHCQKMFTFPHCLILHMQNDCSYRNWQHPSSMPSAEQRVVKQPIPITPKPATICLTSNTPTIIITSVTSGVAVQTSTPGTVRLEPTSSDGQRRLSYGRGRKRNRPVSGSSDSDDPDDPFWKPKESTAPPILRRSIRLTDDVVIVEPTSKDLISVE